MGGGTEAFPDLGMHCQRSDCRQLDFLPFKCNACLQVFCVEHRSYESHECPKSGHDSRKVIVCEICSTSIETTGRNGDDEKAILEKHEKSGDCDPKKKKKPICPVRRCKETLTFSNTSTCKVCRLKFCLKHRFPADHRCNETKTSIASAGEVNSKFLIALASRIGNNLAMKDAGSTSSPPKTPSIEAY